MFRTELEIFFKIYTETKNRELLTKTSNGFIMYNKNIFFLLQKGFLKEILKKALKNSVKDIDKLHFYMPNPFKLYIMIEKSNLSNTYLGLSRLDYETCFISLKDEFLSNLKYELQEY